MKKFIGREQELKKLNKETRKEGMSVSLIFGRRRVGKSELVKQVLRNMSIKKIYYECKEVAEASNAKGLCDIVSEVFNLPKLGYTNIEETLDYIFQLSINEKVILVLDEYPYMRKYVEGMDSILQSLIDKYRDISQLKLFILGSYVDVMKHLLENSNPLYGRVDCIIDLKQMDYFESSQFYSNFSEEDKVRIYSVFGGIPFYNQMIDDSLSVKENIIELIASPGSRLEQEVPMYLGSEISKIVNANEVFETLAKGYCRYGDIWSQSHVSSSPALADILEKLIKMEVVAKTSPINDENNKKKTKYYICDNLTMFYYRYIFRYSSQMNIMDPEYFYEKYIEKDLEEQYIPHQFEEICKQYLIRQNKKGLIDPIFEKIGKYYYDNPKEKTNGEFDIVTLDEQGYVFYEVKFRTQPLSNKLIEHEINQVQQTGLNCYRYVFISKSGFEGNETDLIKHIHLNALYQS